MQEIKWTIENTFLQIDAAVRNGNIAHARILMQNLIEYIKMALIASPGLMAWWNSAGLAGRMAALGFTSSEIAAITTVVAAAEAEGVAAAGGVATVRFFCPNNGYRSGYFYFR